jgi:hypothetical protein
MALETQLLQTIALLYRMESADVTSLTDDLLERRKADWITAISEESNRHGCTRRGEAPRLQDLAELRDLSEQDAKSIAQTWNRDLERQLTKLYNANPRGNRFYYFSNLERWAGERDRWKLPQIAIQTAQTTRAYAQNRFREVNGLRGGKYIFSGPPPVCEICVNEFAQGVVSEQYVQRHPCPRHIGCPHEWQALRPDRLNCNDIWVG